MGIVKQRRPKKKENVETSIVNFLDFNFEGKDIRIEDRDGNIWFVAADICNALEIKNHRDACKDLDDDEKDYVVLNDAIGRPQKTLIISESGVYKLIFRSRKPEAKRMWNWVSKEVLPSIRKTGSYSVEPVIESKNNNSELNDITKMKMELIERCHMATLNSIMNIKSDNVDENKIEQVTNKKDESKKLKSKQTKRSRGRPRIKEIPPKHSETRKKLYDHMKWYMHYNHIISRSIWTTLYKKFEEEYNVKIRNQGRPVLDYVEVNGLMKKLYAFALSYFDYEIEV